MGFFCAQTEGWRKLELVRRDGSRRRVRAPLDEPVRLGWWVHEREKEGRSLYSKRRMYGPPAKGSPAHLSPHAHRATDLLALCPLFLSALPMALLLAVGGAKGAEGCRLLELPRPPELPVELEGSCGPTQRASCFCFFSFVSSISWIHSSIFFLAIVGLSKFVSLRLRFIQSNFLLFFFLF